MPDHTGHNNDEDDCQQQYDFQVLHMSPRQLAMLRGFKQ
jgi:hypothetical protein